MPSSSGSGFGWVSPKSMNRISTKACSTIVTIAPVRLSCGCSMATVLIGFGLGSTYSGLVARMIFHLLRLAMSSTLTVIPVGTLWSTCITMA